MKYTIITAEDLSNNSNNKKSYLTPAQQKIVHSTPFKSWFGDWTKKSKRNCSKVLHPETGEPLVCYHGTLAEVKKGFKFNPSFWNKNGSDHGRGFYFIADRRIARGYAQNRNTKGSIVSVFLNIRKPLDVKAKSIKEINRNDLTRALIRRVIAIQEGPGKEAYKDSFLSNYVDTYSNSYSYCLSHATNMILEDSPTIVDILAELGNISGSYTDVYKAMNEAFGYDGYINNDFNKTGKDVFVCWFPNQIKSIRNKVFDANKEEIDSFVR